MLKVYDVMRKPGIKEVYCTYAVYIARFLNKFKLNLSKKIPQKVSRQALFFEIIQFLHEHGNSIIHLREDQFKIPELNEVFSMSDANLFAFNSYFKEKKRMKFFKREDGIYVRVRDFVFLLPFPYGIFELAETFYDECYGGFDVSNGTVIDVGAFIGDTAIYFAGEGAKKVIAFEPAPPMYETAIRNVQMNKLGNIINVRNEAVGERYGETMVKYEKLWPGLSSTFSSTRNRSKSYYKVKAIPISDVILGLDRVDLLKIDCEGCEHRILLHAYKSRVLRNISNIIVEIHGNPYTILGLFSKSSYKIIKKMSHGKNLHLIHACKEQV